MTVKLIRNRLLDNEGIHAKMLYFNIFMSLTLRVVTAPQLGPGFVR